MKPSELRALLEKASPGPWTEAHLAFVWGNTGANDRETIVALVNLAPLLIELWEASRDWDQCDVIAGEEVSYTSIADALRKLEES
jgi:hypothetical protein